MVMYAKIRRMFFREHLSISKIQRRTSLSRNTIKKWLKESDESAAKYRRAKADGLLTPFEPWLLLALEADARRPKKDRRTAKMLFKAILNEGYESPRFFRRHIFLSQAASADSSCWR